MARLILYGGGRSRWVRPLWMLREIGAQFDAVEVDRPGGQLDSATFRALNPLGKIPVLVDDGRPLFESGAILLYLGDKFPAAGLLPRAGTFERGVHDQWMFTTATEFEQPLWRLHRQVVHGEGDASVAALARRDFARAAAPFEAAVGRGPYMTGSRFAAVDIMLVHLLTWGVAQPLLADWPALAAYRDRCTAREAFPAWLYA